MGREPGWGAPGAPGKQPAPGPHKGCTPHLGSSPGRACGVEIKEDVWSCVA